MLVREEPDRLISPLPRRRDGRHLLERDHLLLQELVPSLALVLPQMEHRAGALMPGGEWADS